jgi:hypothetical protein
MEPDDPLPHSQVSAICHYPEPAQYSPYPPHPTLPEDGNVMPKDVGTTIYN